MLDDDPHARQMVESIRQLLISEADLREGDGLVASRWVRQTVYHAADFSERHAWHFDYGQHSSAVFSATLYTGVDGEEELVGGYTAFADTPRAASADLTAVAEEGGPGAPGLERLPNGTAHLHRGLVIAPRPGRVVIFSGGAENYHAPLPVAQGRRQSLQVWFTCQCGDADRTTGRGRGTSKEHEDDRGNEKA
jgi:hypothetical protein